MLSSSHAITITTHVPQQQHFPNEVHRGWQTYVRDLAKKNLFMNLKIIWANADEGCYRKIPCAVTKVTGSNSGANYEPSRTQTVAASDNKAFKDISSFNSFWMIPRVIRLIHTLS